MGGAVQAGWVAAGSGAMGMRISAEGPGIAILATTLCNLPFGTLYAFSVFLDPWERSLGASRSELAIVFGLATVTLTAGMNLAPRLFGVMAPAAIVGLSVLTGAIGVALAAFATDLIILGVGYGVLFGVGGGVSFIALQQGVNLLLRSHRGLVNGYITSLYPMGAMIAAPLFGWGLAAWGLEGTLIGLAGAIVLAGGLATMLVRIAAIPMLAPEGTPAGEGAPPPRFLFWQMMAVFFLAAAAGLMVMSQSFGIIAAYGGETALALFATSAITGAIAASRVGGGWLLDRFSIPAVIVFSHGWSLVGAVALTVFPSPWVSVFALAMIGMGYGFVSGGTSGAIAYYWPSREFGKVASRLYVAWCVAALSLPVLAGYLFDLAGGYGTAIVLAGVGNLAGILVALGLPRQKRAPA